MIYYVTAFRNAFNWRNWWRRGQIRPGTGVNWKFERARINNVNNATKKMSKKGQTLPPVQNVSQFSSNFFLFNSSSSNNLPILNSSSYIANFQFSIPLSTESLFNSIEKSCSLRMLSQCFRKIIRSILIYRLMIYPPPFLLSFLSLFLVFFFFSTSIPFSLL